MVSSTVNKRRRWKDAKTLGPRHDIIFSTLNHKSAKVGSPDKSQNTFKANINGNLTFEKVDSL